MKKLMILACKRLLPCCLSVLILKSCTGPAQAPSVEAISAIDLKKGATILCGPPGEEFGRVDFPGSCSDKVKKDFNLAIALLHSFEYDEAEKAFARVIDQEPSCAMAYWGVAMSNYHQVWAATPTPAELEKGSKAITIAKSVKQKSPLEEGFIDAMAVFYANWNTADHRTRSLAFAKSMEHLFEKFPAEKEVAIFYALSLDATADPADKSFSNQRKAGAVLSGLYPNEPDHPGIVHYIIHSYDYPELASMALPAARKYASIAPSSAHALHMPSHIFTRLGLWDEAIQSNLASTSSAKCYGESAGIKGHWDEELHGMDYLVYAYLQKGDNALAKKQFHYLESMKVVQPMNFKVAYAFAAIPSRYYLENKAWKEAATIQLNAIVPWQNFPWQKAIIHFARLLGAAHTGNTMLARTELNHLREVYDTLNAKKNTYQANQVMIQAKAGEAWILLQEGKSSEALQLMRLAAEMEDKTEKSPVTPGEVIPAKELLGDMLLRLKNYAAALAAYEEDLLKHPNRFNGIYGAALASEKMNNAEKATNYYKQLITVANAAGADRQELQAAKLYLKQPPGVPK